MFCRHPFSLCFFFERIRLSMVFWQFRFTRSIVVTCVCTRVGFSVWLVRGEFFKLYSLERCHFNLRRKTIYGILKCIFSYFGVLLLVHRLNILSILGVKYNGTCTSLGKWMENMCIGYKNIWHTHTNLLHGYLGTFVQVKYPTKWMDSFRIPNLWNEQCVWNSRRTCVVNKPNIIVVVYGMRTKYLVLIRSTNMVCSMCLSQHSFDLKFNRSQLLFHLKLLSFYHWIARSHKFLCAIVFLLRLWLNNIFSFEVITNLVEIVY